MGKYSNKSTMQLSKEIKFVEDDKNYLKVFIEIYPWVFPYSNKCQPLLKLKNVRGQIKKPTKQKSLNDIIKASQ